MSQHVWGSGGQRLGGSAPAPKSTAKTAPASPKGKAVPFQPFTSKASNARVAQAVKGKPQKQTKLDKAFAKKPGAPPTAPGSKASSSKVAEPPAKTKVKVKAPLVKSRSTIDTSDEEDDGQPGPSMLKRPSAVVELDDSGDERDGQLVKRAKLVGFSTAPPQPQPAAMGQPTLADEIRAGRLALACDVHAAEVGEANVTSCPRCRQATNFDKRVDALELPVIIAGLKRLQGDLDRDGWDTIDWSVDETDMKTFKEMC